MRNFIYYLLAVNIYSFIVMGLDKWKAKNKAYRVSENTLLLNAILGGAFGSILGMYIFHHKTKKKKFFIGIPIIIILQILLYFNIKYKV
ncbi:MAG: DUF1294 domain-containing protein [Fusobacteriaceae bacterium]|nr:DUF1294 domain-containing protein [Fusobacteriaceae bacterium]MBN2838611.1 DUF1294 domain-containing protein [Fusobacteriaceae bacterium]